LGAVALSFSCLVIFAQIGILTTNQKRKAIKWFFAGCILAGSYFLIKISTNHFDQRFLLVSGWVDGGLGSEFGNRPATIMALLLWPTLFFVGDFFKDRMHVPQWVLQTGFFFIVLVSVLLTNSETSKFGLLIGCCCFLVAMVSTWLARWVVKCSLIIAILFMPLLTDWMYQSDWHQSSLIQFSAKHRMVHWSVTNNLISQELLVGHGIRATYKTDTVEYDTNGEPLYEDLGSGHKVLRSVNQHPHNMFLQIWVEFGLLGAVLTLLGVHLFMNFISRQNRYHQPYILACFSTFIIIATTGYGMWQTWILAGILWVTIAFGLAMSRNGEAGFRASPT
jgi:O-antigen ligase